MVIRKLIVADSKYRGYIIRSILLLLLLASGLSHGEIKAQCATTNIAGNLAPANGDTLSGTYIVSGDFIVGPGITIYVRPYTDGACGTLEVIAAGNINIAGTINAENAGLAGGAGGAAGSANNVGMIEQCISTSTCDIFTYGGAGGGDGSITPGGGGLGGVDGGDGSGRNNTCNLFGDETGRVGGSGGGGAGGGGTYGGTGRSGQNGGPGTVPTVTTPDNNSCSNNPIVAGGGPVGGNTGTGYGTQNGFDIDLGSGGGGAGGGGRGRFPGTNGQPGGNGGGLVILESGGNFTFSGTINADGGDGGNGGNGGDAGESPRCCSNDFCHETDEHTHTGAGGGGGGGGGGSGGGILLRIGGIANISGNLSATGGNGGTGGDGGDTYFVSRSTNFLCGSTTTTATAPAAPDGGLGGAGGGGRVKIFYNECAPGNSVVPNFFVGGGNGAFGNANLGTTFISSAGSMIAGNVLPLTQTICYGGDPGQMTAGITQGGYGPIFYQWQYQPGCAGTWLNFPGADTLIFNPPAGLTQSTCYRLVSLSGSCIRYSDTITVNVQPQLAASIIPAGTTGICQGDTVPLNANIVPGATYQWLFNGLPVTGATDTLFYGTQTGDYSVVITYPNGCTALSPPSTVVIQAPPPAFVSPAGSTILCPGDAVTLNGLGGGLYQWYHNGNPIPGAQGQSIIVDSTGNYSVEVTSGLGCTSISGSVSVTAGTVPTASAVALGDTVFCQGDSVLLQGAGGGSYQWLYYNAAVPGANNQVNWALQAGDYSVVVTNNDGCKDTSNVIPVAVYPQPQAGIFSVGPFQICAGDSVLFTASGGGDYQWLFNQQPSVGDTTQFLVGTQPGDYTVVVTGPGGCTDTSITYAMTWFPPINPSIVPPGPHELCPGDTVALAAQGLNMIGWQWERNDTLIPGANGPTFQATQTGAYTVIVTDNYGCEFESNIAIINPGADPIAGIEIASPYPVCGGDSVILEGIGGDSYQWLESANPIAGATDSLYSVLVDGFYSVIAYTGCGEDTSGWLPIQIFPGPVADWYYGNLPESEVEFSDQSISGATWFWDFGDGTTSTEQNPVHQFPGWGEYTVTMITTDIFGCSDTAIYNVIVKEPDFFIPNVFSPNNDGINDQAATDFTSLESFNFWIFDRWGAEVFYTNDQGVWWDGYVNGKPAADGVYFYRLEAVKIGEEETFEVVGNISLLR